MMSLEEILDQIRVSEPIDGVPLPKGTRALELLQMVYRGQYKATAQQIRAAVEALAFESPKLTAVAHFDGNFAEQLDQAIERRSMKIITHEPVPEAKPVPTEPHSPDELKGNFPKLRRRI
jgi:hypothetical protein